MDWSQINWLAIALHLGIGFPLGLLYTNAGEWVIHKHLLHIRGKKKGSFWSFHWYDHHNRARRFSHFDRDYESGMGFQWNARTKEAVGLTTAAVVHFPLLFIVPGFYVGIVYSVLNYYLKHKKSHLDGNWARTHLTWHYDHHMGPNQDANWCVTRPWFDIIMGTREYYVGTERERADLERQAARAAVKRATPDSGAARTAS